MTVTERILSQCGVTPSGCLIFSGNPSADYPATATGADTDTLASMTAALLGAVAGHEWIGEAQQQIQDHGYLESLASALAHRTPTPETAHEERRVGGRDMRRVIDELQNRASNRQVELPDGRQATITGSDPLQLRGRPVGNRWRLATADGQILFVKHLLCRA